MKMANKRPPPEDNVLRSPIKANYSKHVIALDLQVNPVLKGSQI
jgi:hypothetical protein